ncbi:Atxe2 family lasso peptide isopeptidase [Peristeroidobacter soli]|uniref:Atxe2 family lasso peptide isopeptidase n=1 Tax=Peristeroidobacter soli TaxID=2497877 RepID=UPI00130057F8|nr:Atxe2 family lasso peptide isopeptidase [Peristeroidobacter soli]
MKRYVIPLCLGLAATLLTRAAVAAETRPPLVIPSVVVKTEPRAITVDDMTALRRIDSLSLSPDRRRYVISVRQGDPLANEYRLGWFIGDTSGGALTPVAQGGEARLAQEGPGGRVGGSIERQTARWSPDGQWIAYPSVRHGEVQLWRAKVDGSLQEQLTHNAADVREFAWSEDGSVLYFAAGTPRAELRALEEKKERGGYQYDDDLNFSGDLLLPQRERGWDKDRSVWVVTLADQRERLASDAENEAFKLAKARNAGGGGARLSVKAPQDAIFTVNRGDGAAAWLARGGDYSFRVNATISGNAASPVACVAQECAGFIEKLWWRGQEVLFFRREGSGGGETGIYAWSPTRNAVSTVLHTVDDFFWYCDQAAAQLICVRQTKARPAHVVAIDMRSGKIRELADVNPEFRNIRLGKVERFEWQTPQFPWLAPGQPLAGAYPERTFGYILYPPDFDPEKKYPVLVEPYSAVGFDNATNYELPLHVFAASGMVVLNTTFPTAINSGAARRGADSVKLKYSAELDFPHLTMYMESTLRALDVVAARGFVDERRVGIGGVSHGSFVPLYMVLKHDRLAAVSLSSPGWGQWEYYQATRAGRKASAAGYSDWMVKPEGAGLDFWKRIDLADNVDTIEAPILIQAAANEMSGQIRLMNHMAEAGKPYDAYVFAGETHIKWQPAHLRAIGIRNIDWFRFWLQSYEDPDPAKTAQYQRWRKLRELQELKAPRSATSPAALN